MIAPDSRKTSALLYLDGVHVSFDGFHAINNLSLTIAPGEYAVHGTSPSMRHSVGHYASYGCIRMLNEDVSDLYNRVRVGTPIIVVP